MKNTVYHGLNCGEESQTTSFCELLISVTSAGQIVRIDDQPYFVLIEKALRDEGTSYHYLPPADFSHISTDLLSIPSDAFLHAPVAVHGGATWTTDAPFRETEAAIVHSRDNQQPYSIPKKPESMGRYQNYELDRFDKQD